MAALLAMALYAEAAGSVVTGGSGPQPIGDPAFWASACQVGPADSCIPSGNSGFELSPEPMTIILMIDPKGRVSKCDVISSDQDMPVDLQVCNSLRRRATFEPARDEGGQPIASAWSMQLRFSNVPGGDSRSFPAKPDLVVTTDQLGLGETGKLVVVREVIRPDSSLESCVVQQTSGNMEIDALACDSVRAKINSPPVEDGKGNPIRGVRLYAVGFLSN